MSETRLKCRVYEPGLVTGMEIAVTNVLLGLSAETFTITKCTAVWIGAPQIPAWDLELGLGVFAVATTGAEDGGPLDYPGPIDVIEHETYRSLRDPDQPRSIMSNNVWFYLAMDDDSAEDLPPIQIRGNGLSAFAIWGPGSVIITEISGDIAYTKAANAAWISDDGGGPGAEFTITSDPGDPTPWIFVVTGGVYGQTTGGDLTLVDL